MAKQSDFINKIADFTKSLENLVDLLKAQNKVGPTEVVNKLLESLDAKAIAKITEDLEVIKNTTQKISNNVDKTLEAVKSIKKQKETGMFGQVEDKKNKKSVMDGVKTVVLIALGVLAIGMAFKIVGAVDFFSVVALGLGIVFVAHAFAKVASIRDDKGKEIDRKRAGVVSVIMILMAGAILISGLLLNRMPTIGIFQVISIIGVGLAIGIATYLMIKAVHHLKMSSIPKMLLLPLILPAIAIGLVLAGLALNQMPEISYKQILSAIGVGIAMIPVAIAFGIITKAMKGTTLKDIIMSALIIPAMAAGVVLASYILKDTQKIEFWTVIKTAIAVGVASIAMAPAIMFLEKAGLLKPTAIKELLIATMAIPLMSLSLVVSSFILQLVQKFDFKLVINAALTIGLVSLTMAPAIIFLQKSGLLKASAYKDLLIAVAVFPLISLSLVVSSWILLLTKPIKKEVLETGLTIALVVTAMVPTILLLDKFGLTKPSAIMQLLIASAAIVLISAAIMLSSWILSIGNYTNAPDWKWSLGAGLAIIMFTPAIVFLGIVVLSGLGLLALAAGAVGVLLVASTIVATSYILAAGTYSNYPSLGWALGSGVSMLAFGLSMLILGSAILLTAGIGYVAMLVGASAIKLVAETVVATSYILATGSYATYPGLGWALGSGLSMIAFGLSMLILGSAILLTGGLGLAAMAIGAVACLIVAATVVATSYILAAGSYATYPGLGWALGSGLSMIAFGAAMLTLGSAILLTGGLGLAAMAIGAVACLIVAATVVATSYILAAGSYATYPTLGWALGSGMSMILFGTAMMTLGTIILLSFGLGMLALGAGAIAMLIVASTVVQTSYILGMGSYDNYPTVGWILGVGVTMIGFATAMVTLGILFPFLVLGALSVLIVAHVIVKVTEILGAINYEDTKIPSMVLTSISLFTGVMLILSVLIVPLFVGALAMLLVAGTIALTSTILSAGNYTNFPSANWTGGVALSLLAIGMPMMTFGAFILGTFGLGLVALEAGFVGFMIIAANIAVLSTILSTGKYGSYPTIGWVMGVSASLTAFSLLGLTTFSEESMNKLFYIAYALRSYSMLLDSISTQYSPLFSGGPDDVSKKIALSMQELVNAIPKREQIDPIWYLIFALRSLANTPWEEIMNIHNVASMIGFLSSQLDGINERKVGALAKIGAGLHIMAVVDQNKLNATLKVLEDKSRVLSEIFDGSSFINRVFDNAADMLIKTNAAQNKNVEQKGGGSAQVQQKTAVVDKSKQKFQDDLIMYIQKIDTNIEKMSNIQTKDQEEVAKAKNVEGDGKEGGWKLPW